MIQAGARPAEEIRAALSTVVERERIGEDPGPDFLVDLLEWLGIPVSVAFDVLRWVLLALFVLWVVRYFVKRALEQGLRERDAGWQRSDARRARRVEELRDRARAAEAGGDLALALRLEFFALVVALGEHGDLEFRPAWTNRELLARGAPAPELAARLSAELDVIDPKTWGSRGVDAADLARVRALARELVAGVAA